MKTGRWTILLALLLLLPGTQPARAMLLPEEPQPSLPQSRGTLSALSPNPLVCTFTPGVDTLLAGTTLDNYTGWIRKISGEEPWTAGDHTLTVSTRYSPSLFNGTYTGFDLLRDQLLQWYSPDQVEVETYQPYTNVTWKNLILTIRGNQAAGDVVMLTAHYDDWPSTAPAPGADDNASGSATLLEAARLMVGHTLPRTVKMVWFTGEEQGLKGSIAYASKHLQELTSVWGVINLDMYAYDHDNDHCFEMHVGGLPASDRVGQCLAQAVQIYQPELRYDYFISGATNASDHASFWSRNVGAVEIGENFYTTTTPNGCGSVSDMNANYHKSQDTLANINLETAYPIHRAALAAFFAMASANPIKYYFPYLPHQIP